MTEVQVSMLFVGRNCPKCGVPFMITDAHLAMLKMYGRALYCPNGHVLQFRRPSEPSHQPSDLQRQLDAALQLAGEEQERRVEVEAALAQNVEDGDGLRRERDEALESAQAAHEKRIDAESKLMLAQHNLGEREKQLASLQELAERGRLVDSALEVFTPPTLEEVKTEPSRVDGLNWRDTEQKECPECHTIFKPRPTHTKYQWEKKIYCTQTCLIAHNTRVAKEKAEQKRAARDDLKPEPETSPPLDQVSDAEIEASGLEAESAPELVHLEEPPEIAREVSVMLVRQGCDLVIDRSDCPPPTTKPGPTFVVNGEPVVAPRLNRPVRPDRVPGPTVQRPPVLPPAQQGRLPDPRPPSDWQPVVVQATLERLDNGSCPDCGRPLNAFKKCGYCTQQSAWRAGQKAKIGAAP